MSEQPPKREGSSFMVKLATFIVDKRNLFFLLTIIAIIFSVISRNWIMVENELAEYLPDHSEARQGLDVMEEQFITYGSARVMVANVTLPRAEELHDALAALDGVQSVTFDSDEDYKDVSALYTVTFDYADTDEQCLEALDRVEEAVSGEDCYISTDLGDQQAEILESEVSVIMVWVAVIVIAVLCFTSQTWAEVPVLLLTFVAAMILNLGTNFLLGTISFVSNSVTSILQLALSLDYAVILCNRFKEEHQTLPLREAVIMALSKGIPEIGASSLTTIGGLVAMMFMQFRIGPDMAICLIKSILYALLAVFVIMPGLLMLFGPLMEKTAHRSFIPKIPFVGKFAYATRYVIPPLFIAALVLAFQLSGDCPYAYGYGNLETPKLNEAQVAENMTEDTFGAENFVALVVPGGDYDAERKLLAALEGYDEVDYTMGLSNVEAMDGYMLADKLTPRQFAELTDLDYEAAQVLYAAYAAKSEDYGEIVGSLSTYSVPLIDILLFACDQIDSGVVTLEEEQAELLHRAKTMMESGKNQLQGEEYNRILVYLNLPVSGEETYAFLDTLRDTARLYYPKGNIYVVGQSTTEYDFQKSFERDNLVVTIVSILIVLVVLLFTFKSAGMPVLLILVIQGAIWINFSIPTLRDRPIFFMSYLVVSSIQMGANIDYAIVIASRFSELKQEMTPRQAVIETMNFAFPTIITSGTILAVAGTLIGRMTSEAAIVGIGESIGRGTMISMILVMFVLPQILLLGSRIVDKTSFSVPVRERTATASGRVRIEGMVHGEIHGTISGMVRATVDGDVDLNVISGTADEEGAEEEEHEEEFV
ncbi:MAG: RND family transporter [Oscillospiraceae bacterium]